MSCLRKGLYLFVFARVEKMEMSKMDRHKETDLETARETGRQHDQGPEKGLQEENGKNMKEKKRIYAKETTITIDITELQNGGVEDIIKAISEKVGVYEVTLDKEDICDELVNGVEGTQYFRIIHSQQVKTCRLCMSPKHILKYCPEFACYKCEEQGHFARGCKAVKCPDCFKTFNKCECWMDSREWEEEEEEEQEESGKVQEEATERKEMQATEEQQELTVEEERENGNVQAESNEGERTDEEESMEQGIWTPIEVKTNAMDEHNGGEKSQNMEKSNGHGPEDKRGDKNLGQMGRRRSFKVTSNLEACKKIRVIWKSVNRFDAIRNLEEKED